MPGLCCVPRDRNEKGTVEANSSLTAPAKCCSSAVELSLHTSMPLPLLYPAGMVLQTLRYSPNCWWAPLGPLTIIYRVPRASSRIRSHSHSSLCKSFSVLPLQGQSPFAANLSLKWNPCQSPFVEKSRSQAPYLWCTVVSS